MKKELKQKKTKLEKLDGYDNITQILEIYLNMMKPFKDMIKVLNQKRSELSK